MPPHMTGDVPFSTLNDRMHNGTRSAGNKSALSYRPDLGIPGYTGYIPSGKTVPLDPKNCNPHIVRLAGEPDKQQALLDSTEIAAASEYRSTFRAAAADFKPPSKTGGGYWFRQRNDAAAQSSQPFIGATTYQSELEAGEASSRVQLGLSLGLSCNLVAYETARKGRARLAGSLSSTTQQLASGELVGYTTSYGAMTAAMRGAASDVLLQHSASMRRSGQPQQEGEATPDVRHKVVPDCSCALPAPAHTSYRQDFGRLGGDPLSRAAPAARLMALSATSSDLAAGTARGSLHVPGYCGHVPASQKAAQSAQSAIGGGTATGADSRPDHKAQSLLFALDQYSRSRVPHYTGFKAQDPANVDTAKFNAPPAPRTIQGVAQQIAAQLAPEQRATGAASTGGQGHGANTSAGIMGFFTSDGPQVSDNGLFDAQCFFQRVSPLEGRLRKGLQKPSETTAYGAKFNPANSLV